MPIVNLPGDELSAIIAVIRQAIEDDKYPHAPRLDPLKAALARLIAASELTPPPKPPSAGKADKQTRRP